MRGCLEEQNLVVVVSVMTQIAALFADEFIVHAAVSHVVPTVVRAQTLFGLVVCVELTLSLLEFVLVLALDRLGVVKLLNREDLLLML